MVGIGCFCWSRLGLNCWDAGEMPLFDNPVCHMMDVSFPLKSTQTLKVEIIHDPSSNEFFCLKSFC